MYYDDGIVLPDVQWVDPSAGQSIYLSLVGADVPNPENQQVRWYLGLIRVDDMTLGKYYKPGQPDIVIELVPKADSGIVYHDAVKVLLGAAMYEQIYLNSELPKTLKPEQIALLKQRLCCIQDFLD